MITCTRKLEFDAGHRVFKHESKCRHPHGHRYAVLFEAMAKPGKNPLDPLGRVIDFSVLKERIGGYIDAQMDHGFLCWAEDHEMIQALSQVTDCKLYVMSANPTAENIAAHFMQVICPALLKDTAIEVISVRVFETPNCWATAGVHHDKIEEVPQCHDC